MSIHQSTNLPTDVFLQSQIPSWSQFQFLDQSPSTAFPWIHTHPHLLFPYHILGHFERAQIFIHALQFCVFSLILVTVQQSFNGLIIIVDNTAILSLFVVSSYKESGVHTHNVSFSSCSEKSKFRRIPGPSPRTLGIKDAL